jgi:hypothetical protein
MIVHERAAARSIHYLEQGAELIRCLDGGLYANCPNSPFPGGVGAQLRHCIDFYDCLLTSLAAGRVDYTHRGRDPRLETDRDLAQKKIDALILALSRLGGEEAERELLVRTEASTGSAEGWTRSTVRRELDFLVSHTIHHFALIVMLLDMHGFKIPQKLEGFGVAPSTLRHWSESGQFPE